MRSASPPFAHASHDAIALIQVSVDSAEVVLRLDYDFPLGLQVLQCFRPDLLGLFQLAPGVIHHLSLTICTGLEHLDGSPDENQNRRACCWSTHVAGIRAGRALPGRATAATAPRWTNQAGVLDVLQTLLDCRYARLPFGALGTGQRPHLGLHQSHDALRLVDARLCNGIVRGRPDSDPHFVLRPSAACTWSRQATSSASWLANTSADIVATSAH
ncbi:hypothetical protein PBRA_003318 [Plasmodiophora brassicae]|uniref:Uncharacterized protein n=1 Tax=Plasmodiophora brassicae TaxID=37360 RepID=A0A0G4J8W3_PLABS|nr:hypothetical protein PBRA_003318 [Plasmodiophora brassicae]